MSRRLVPGVVSMAAPRPTNGLRPTLAAHVQAALQPKNIPVPVQLKTARPNTAIAPPKTGPSSPSPDPKTRMPLMVGGAIQRQGPTHCAALPPPPRLPKRTRAVIEAYVPHVRAAVLRPWRSHKTQQQESPSKGLPAVDYVSYDDKKAAGITPPLPKKPVFRLHFDIRGANCRVEDLKSGRSTDAGSLYGGFVRMSKDGATYLSPRTTVGLRGDSHPTIASQTPEWARGQRRIAAAGEVGIVDNAIVGHNDKTGHYRTRKNKSQSGMPEDRFFPYTIDPKHWFKDR